MASDEMMQDLAGQDVSVYQMYYNDCRRRTANTNFNYFASSNMSRSWDEYLHWKSKSSRVCLGPESPGSSWK